MQTSQSLGDMTDQAPAHLKPAAMTGHWESQRSRNSSSISQRLGTQLDLLKTYTEAVQKIILNCFCFTVKAETCISIQCPRMIFRLFQPAEPPGKNILNKDNIYQVLMLSCFLMLFVNRYQLAKTSRASFHIANLARLRKLAYKLLFLFFLQPNNKYIWFTERLWKACTFRSR